MAVQDAAGARESFQGLSADLYGSISSALIEQEREVRDTLLATATRPADAGWSMWGSAIGNWGNYPRDDGVTRLDLDNQGLLAGVVRTSGPFSLGVTGGYVHLTADQGDWLASANVNSVIGAVHAEYRSGRLLIALGGEYASHDVSADRRYSFAGIGSAARANYDAIGLQGFGEASYAIVRTLAVTLAPFAGYTFSHLHQDGFTERGGEAPLVVDRGNRDVQFGSLGVQVVGNNVLRSKSTRFSPSLKVGWQHAWGGRNGAVATAFNGSQEAFLVNGQAIAKDQLLLRGGGEFTSGRMSIGVAFTLAEASSYNTKGGTVTFTLEF